MVGIGIDAYVWLVSVLMLVQSYLEFQNHTLGVWPDRQEPETDRHSAPEHQVTFFKTYKNSRLSAFLRVLFR